MHMPGEEGNLTPKELIFKGYISLGVAIFHICPNWRKPDIRILYPLQSSITPEYKHGMKTIFRSEIFFAIHPLPVRFNCFQFVIISSQCAMIVLPLPRQGTQ